MVLSQSILKNSVIQTRAFGRFMSILLVFLVCPTHHITLLFAVIVIVVMYGFDTGIIV